MSEKSKKIVALILAAGESSRLGKPKQNLIYEGKTLLSHTKEQFNSKFVDRTFIVLGAYAKEIIKTSNLSSAEVIEFKGWKEGMGSSLAHACRKIFSDNKCDGILITLSDLPLVTNSDYQKMIDLFETKYDIIATKANNSVGVPAIFGAAYFRELEQLKGEKGAKPIIQKNIKKVKIFMNERAGVDMDTLDDVQNLEGMI